MEFAHTFGIGDVVSLIGTIVGLIAAVSAFKFEIRALKKDAEGSEMKYQALASHLQLTATQTALTKAKVEKHEVEIASIHDRQAVYDSKLFEKLSRMERSLARLEGKMGVGEGEQ